jgi:hypothetical protein
MMFSRLFRRSAALAAAAAIALQALWPLIAQARAGDSVSVPICSVDGTRHEIQLPIGKTNDGTQHCKLCVLGTDKPFVANAVGAFASFAGKSESILEKEKSSFKPLSEAFARPRAPPQVS